VATPFEASPSAPTPEQGRKHGARSRTKAQKRPRISFFLLVIPVQMRLKSRPFLYAILILHQPW
jgi:hypothetical protein